MIKCSKNMQAKENFECHKSKIIPECFCRILFPDSIVCATALLFVRRSEVGLPSSDRCKPSLELTTKNITDKEERESSPLECFPFLPKSANMGMRRVGSRFDFSPGGKSGAGSILTFTMFFFPNFPLAVLPPSSLRLVKTSPLGAGYSCPYLPSSHITLLPSPQNPLASHVLGLIQW